MHVKISPIIQHCNYCSAPATRKINLTFFAEYMFKYICDDAKCEETAIKELESHIPRDR